MPEDFGLYSSNILYFIIAVYSFLRKGSGEGSFEPFSLVSSATMHGNGSKLHQGRLKLNVRKHVFVKKVVKHWNRLSESVFDAPSLSLFKRHLDDTFINMLELSDSPGVVRLLDQVILLGPFQLQYSIHF